MVNTGSGCLYQYLIYNIGVTRSAPDQQADLAGDAEFARMAAEEAAWEERRAAAHASDVERSGGVAWSGLGPEPFSPRSAARIEADAAARLLALRRWRATCQGRFLISVARAQRAAADAHLAGEAARDAVARDFDAERDRCSAAARTLETHAQILLAAARAARRALEVAEPRRSV